MHRHRVKRGWAAVLVWLPVGLLLSAAECRPQMSVDAEARTDRLLMQQRMRWDAERQRKLAQEAQAMQLQWSPSPTLPFDYRTGRNPDARPEIAPIDP